MILTLRVEDIEVPDEIGRIVMDSENERQEDECFQGYSITLSYDVEEGGVRTTHTLEFPFDLVMKG